MLLHYSRQTYILKLETIYIRTETIKAVIFPITAPVQQGMGQICKRKTANVTLSHNIYTSKSPGYTMTIHEANLVEFQFPN